MKNKLFVWNIAWTASKEDLEELFWQHWTVTDVFIIKDRETWRSKWFWFITFENDDDAASAVEALSGYELEWRALVVNIAKPKE